MFWGVLTIFYNGVKTSSFLLGGREIRSTFLALSNKVLYALGNVNSYRRNIFSRIVSQLQSREQSCDVWRRKLELRRLAGISQSCNVSRDLGPPNVAAPAKRRRSAAKRRSSVRNHADPFSSARRSSRNDGAPAQRRGVNRAARLGSRSLELGTFGMELETFRMAKVLREADFERWVGTERSGGAKRRSGAE